MTLLVERAPAHAIDRSRSILRARSLRIANEDATTNVVAVAGQQRPLQMVQSLMSGAFLNYRYFVENEYVRAIPHTVTPVTMPPLRPDGHPDGGVATTTPAIPALRKTRVRFGPNETLYIGRCSAKRHILWWSKEELERMRNQSRTMLTDEERQSLNEYLHAVELECVRILEPNESSPKTTSDFSQKQLICGLALGHQGLERFAPLELLRERHRRSTVRDIVALSRSWARHPYRSDLIQAAYVPKAGPAVEWALYMGTASDLARSPTTTGTLEPPEDQTVAVATWMRETRDYQRIEV
jgi:hypothetical protein